MKKIVLTLAAVSLLLACNKQEDAITTTDDNAINAVTKRSCHTDVHFSRQLAANPSLRERMEEFELKSAQAIAEGRIVNGVMEIPVVVNVLYKTTTENISLAQIQSQIDVLNKDYNAQNTDYNTANNPYSNVRANVGIRFTLDKVNRKYTEKSSWSEFDTDNDLMKKTNRGGIDPTSPSTKLNLWIVSSMPTSVGQTLGYAQFPGGASATDGVVLAGKYTGTTGTAKAPFNLGRTATHEIGHWMNLRHIWGDKTCGSDLVSDTPVHNASNTGTPAVGHRSTCTGTPLEMYMNYMDYTDDKAMYMFTIGQKARMNAIFAVGGSRASFR